LEKPLLLIKEASDEIKAISHRLEPVKDGSISTHNGVLYTEFTTRLAWQDSFRTFKWRDVIGDLEVFNKETIYLLSLV
jgi:hypothetical protein